MRDGFKDAMLQNGLTIDESCIIFGNIKPKVYGELSSDTEWESILDYVIDEKKVDCIISGNALFVFGAVSYFRKKRIKLQRDILFGTFDNAFWMKNLDEEIIVVEQNTKAMGEKAANILLNRLNGESFIYDDYCIETRILTVNENK